MADGPITVGIAGLGRAGWSLHALGVEAHPSFRLVAVNDPDLERRSEATERFGCRAYETYEELVADAEIELMVVATPSHLHAPMACAALSAGKHALVDKPMALRVNEADEMLALARKSGKILTAFHTRRVDSEFLKIEEIVGSGVLGPLHEIKLSVYSYDRRFDWQTLRKLGGGQLNNWGSHLIDIALKLGGGEWRDLFSDLRQVAYAGDAEDHVKLVFRGRDGVVVDVEIGVSPISGGSRWLILGKYGSLRSDGERLEWRFYDPKGLAEPVASEGAAPERKYGSGETLPWITESVELTYGDTTQRYYDRLYASIREGAPLLVPPEETRNLIALQDACRAQREGR